MRREIKQEASRPVQARVSIGSLAELDMYWMQEGRDIRSMSQLIAWSIDLLCEVLRANSKLPKSIESVAEAHQYLMDRGLYQASMTKRGFKKIGAAIKFESLRGEGIDPSKPVGVKGDIQNRNVTMDYNILHNKRSIDTFDEKGVSSKIEEMVKVFENLNEDSIVPDISNPRLVKKSLEDPNSEVGKRFKAIADRDREEQEELDRFIMKRTPNVKEGEDNGSV